MKSNKIKDIIAILENAVPLDYQEEYDNCGLITGDINQDVQAILISLDCTEEVIEEAISLKANLIISHHPLIYNALKKLTGKNYIERTLIKAIKNNIAIYAAHTNFDNIIGGVSFKIAEKIGLKNCKVLGPKSGYLKKLITFCPIEHSNKVRIALFNAGAGQIGNYDQCSFNAEGFGTFRALENTNPFVGEILKLHKEPEEKIEVIFPRHLQNKLIKALLDNHPYEEVAYDIIPLDNKFNNLGGGVIGELDNEIPAIDFLKKIKEIINIDCIRHTETKNRKIKKIAICGGSGIFLLNDAIKADADIYLTADIKYHQFFDAENKIILADIGHYESEQFTKDLLSELVIKNISNFAVHITNVNTNPIKYLI
ncbi:MAG: Nif3-like dinuclear metal center hexameric protein [Bacteroidota bacterium]|nr:Nif3-like dinuclear metal center hexameric protein [Bacteroidota bacterium]